MHKTKAWCWFGDLFADFEQVGLSPAPKTGSSFALLSGWVDRVWRVPSRLVSGSRGLGYFRGRRAWAHGLLGDAAERETPSLFWSFVWSRVGCLVRNRHQYFPTWCFSACCEIYNILYNVLHCCTWDSVTSTNLLKSEYLSTTL